jgi:FtsP/CotA-like multicopper oxidase with cupredoxin domain
MHRRTFLKLSAGMAALESMRPRRLLAQSRADYTVEIAPLALELAPGKIVHTTAYNGQVPGPLLRMRESESVTIDVINQLQWPEVVHWHGLWIPSSVDGAMEEGTPMVPPAGGRQRVTFVPRPSGFRWYHTHGYAGHNLKKGTYSGQFGCLMVEARENPGRYDQEVFLTLHDWEPYLMGSDDGFMNPIYRYASINGKLLGAGAPIRVKEGERLLLHALNASPTEEHWLALPGHTLEVVALDGNAVPRPRKVRMICLSPAERVDAIVTMDSPGVWVLGEVRKHLQAAGMGVVVEYANRTGKPEWRQPQALEDWDYTAFADESPRGPGADIETVPLVFASKFRGHGDMDYWTINGRSFPATDIGKFEEGKRYRLIFDNQSQDDHPVHFHRHTFELRNVEGKPTSGVRKDVVRVRARTKTEVELLAANPGPTLFHCHQQDHMDLGFMMLFRYV